MLLKIEAQRLERGQEVHSQNSPLQWHLLTKPSPERDSFKITDPSRIFSTPKRNTSTPRVLLDTETEHFDHSRVSSSPGRDGFKIEDPSRVFSTTTRDPSTPRAFFRTRNGIVSKFTTPRAFFRPRNRIVRRLARFFDPGTG